MSTITVKDGTTIYYKDWGKGPVVTFSHGWPLSSDAWDGQNHAAVLVENRAYHGCALGICQTAHREQQGSQEKLPADSDQ